VVLQELQVVQEHQEVVVQVEVQEHQEVVEVQGHQVLQVVQERQEQVVRTVYPQVKYSILTKVLIRIFQVIKN